MTLSYDNRKTFCKSGPRLHPGTALWSQLFASLYVPVTRKHMTSCYPQNRKYIHVRYCTVVTEIFCWYRPIIATKCMRDMTALLICFQQETKHRSVSASQETYSLSVCLHVCLCLHISKTTCSTFIELSVRVTYAVALYSSENKKAMLREHKPPPIRRIPISDFGLPDPKRDPDRHKIVSLGP